MKYREKSTSYEFSIKIIYQQTDLLISYNSEFKDSEKIKSDIGKSLFGIYDKLNQFIKDFPDFRYSLVPIDFLTDDTHLEYLKRMSYSANVGPLAGIAGYFDEKISYIMEKYSDDYFIENGGDIKLKNTVQKKVRLHSSYESFEGNFNIILPPGEYGIASSSGKLGHSLSKGISDLVTVICPDPIKADCFATAIGNEINHDKKIEDILEKYEFLDVVSIIFNGKFFYKGKYKLSL